MTSPLDLDLPRVRCAPFHQELEVDPVGSAAHNDAFLCVEIPLPWDRDIGSHAPFAELSLKGGRHRWRPLGLASETLGRSDASGTPTSFRRVLAYEPRSDAVGSLDLREWLVPEDLLAMLCAAVVSDDHDSVAPFDEHLVVHPDEVIDLLVCTHGRRDTCCGGLGTTMFEALAARDRSFITEAGVDAGGAVTVRTWRTSHLGGHRFAPTMLSLPDAYAWSHLDVGSALRIAARDGDAAELTPMCRGRSTVPGGPAQAAERAALELSGWRWLEADVEVLTVGFDRTTMATGFEVVGRWPDGDAVTFDVTVESAGHVPQPTCGVVTGPEYKVEPVWRVASAERRTSAQ